MSDFVYTAWLQDYSLASDEEDFEFPACFRITADTEQAALDWGDHLAQLMCSRRTQMSFLRSHAAPADTGNPSVAALPLVVHGVLADDSEVGW